MGLFIWRGLSNAPTSPKYLVLSGLGRVQSRLVGSDSRQVVKRFLQTTNTPYSRGWGGSKAVSSDPILDKR